MTETTFYNDKEIARILKLSPSWVRVQRHRRAKGLDHTFTVEPRYIGSSPRYVVEEVEAFVSTIVGPGGRPE